MICSIGVMDRIFGLQADRSCPQGKRILIELALQASAIPAKAGIQAA